MTIRVLEGVEFCDWPTRTPVPQRDRFTAACKRLVKAIRTHLAFLNGDGARRKLTGWKWYRKGIYYCQLRVAGRMIVLNEAGHISFTVSSAEEANELYQRILVAVEVVNSTR